jgi:predicted ATPase
VTSLPIEQVRDALAHLHDPVHLQTHPLAALVGVSDRVSRGRALQRALLEAVDALQPSRDGAPRPRALRQHRLLTRRYVDGLPWEAVRGELLISRSEYYRDHQQALEAVGSLLGERLAAPPPQTAGAAPAPVPALPVYPTSFIGRRAELADAERLLGGTQPATRLLTFTGTGGVGKTRVALEVARALSGPLFPDGAWLVELAPLSDAGRIPQAIAAALGLREEPGRSFGEVLLDALRPRRLLLVLDNCEHLVQACAELAHAILRECPAISIVATSREPLGIAGETVLGVPPLACPRTSAGESLDELQRYDAARLFAERAAAAWSALTLTPTNAAAVARICERLDGLPLALELAAAQVRVLSVEQIADRLDGNSRLLAVSNRATPPRQQTLDATLSWSYDLLSEPEQRLFRRLAVFAGSWTLEAAEDVCSGGGIESDQVTELLARLIDKSLVVTEHVPGDRTRYRLLEPLRQFAFDRLRARGEELDLRTRHLAWCVRLAAEFERVVRLTVEPATMKVPLLRQMRVEHDNLRAAWQWAASGAGDVRAGLRMTAALLAFHFNYGYLSEARAWLAVLLERDADAQPSTARARALSAAAGLAAEDGDHPAARAYAADYLRLPVSVADASSEAGVYDALGTVALREGDLPTARAFLTRAVTRSRQSGEVSGSVYQTKLAGVALQEGDLEQAQHAYEVALADAQVGGVLPAIGLALHGLALVARSSGDTAGAEALYEKGVATLQEAGALPHTVHLMLVALGYIALDRRDAGRACRRFLEALNSSAAFGHRFALGMAMQGIGRLLLEDADERPESLDLALGVLGAAARLRYGVHVAGVNQQEGVYAVAVNRSTEAALERARQRFGRQYVDERLRAGRALRLEQSIAMARTGTEQLRGM